MTEQPSLSFAELLRQLRADVKLTQEELAQAAGLSPRAISDLERGINRTARKNTAMQLAGALGMAGPLSEMFVEAARGRIPAADVLTALGDLDRDTLERRQRVLGEDHPDTLNSARNLGEARET